VQRHVVEGSEGEDDAHVAWGALSVSARHNIDGGGDVWKAYR
jgi:hypothetical protein